MLRELWMGQPRGSGGLCSGIREGVCAGGSGSGESRHQPALSVARWFPRSGDVVANDATKVADQSPASVDALEEVMATLIILDRPDARHIPWFAMAVPSSLEDRATDADIEAGLDHDGIVGQRCLDWIRAHRGDNAIRFMATRNFVEPRTALYVNWLLFRDDALATAFLAAFPRYQFDKRIEQLRRKRQSLTERLEQRLKRGGFDLSQFPEDHRWTIATRYVEAHDKIADLHRHETWLETANRLGARWRDNL
jgi:hypothetical protein